MLHLLWLLYQHSLAVPRSGLSIRCLQQAVDPWMWRLLWWWWWCSAWVGPHIWAHSPYWGSATVPLQWMLLQRHPTSTSGSEDLPSSFTFKKFPAPPPAGLGTMAWAGQPGWGGCWWHCSDEGLRFPPSPQAFPKRTLSCCCPGPALSLLVGLSSLFVTLLALHCGRGQHVTSELHVSFIWEKKAQQGAPIRPCCIIPGENVLCSRINFKSTQFQILYFLYKCCHGHRHWLERKKSFLWFFHLGISGGWKAAVTWTHSAQRGHLSYPGLPVSSFRHTFNRHFFH